MKLYRTLSPLLLASSALLASSQASVVVPRDPSLEEAAAILIAATLKRATPAAPDGYIPSAVACPSPRPSIRTASGLSANETSWLQLRRNNTLPAMMDLLGRLNITGFNATSYLQNNTSALPNIAIAASGGGYRALMNGAGALAAMDSRTTNSTAAGQIGGLLQSSTYLAGLSGGSWLIGSIMTNNFTTVQNIINQNSQVWDFTNSILQGTSTRGIANLSELDYYNQLYDVVHGKANAGYNISITDYWGRALSYQLVNASEGGPAYTFSSIQHDPDFANGNAPMPIILADERAPGQLIVPSNTTNIEFSPFEMGSFDPTLYGFAPLEYVGSRFSGGTLPSNDSCIAGFDNVGFVMGTSSTLFNEGLITLNSTTFPSAVQAVAGKILGSVSHDEGDIADWQPNPFYQFNPNTNVAASSETLTLVDGGEDGQNIPFNPLIQPVRHVDVIFAIDSSADTVYNWPNGTSLVTTYQRPLSGQANGTEFPAVPDENTMVNLGLNQRPTMFGCDAGNTTAPLVVYIPNSPYSFYSNVSTFNLSYSNAARDGIIQNGYNVATMANSSLSLAGAPEWATCVGCAIISRSLNRTGTPVPAVCTQCFNAYCWNETTDSTAPPGNYTPTPKVGGTTGTSGGSGSGTPSGSGAGSSATAKGAAPALHMSWGLLGMVIGAAVLLF